MYKLAFFVPESYKELVKQAVFAQGAGRYEAYDCCSWEALGTGQFKALSGSQPFIGEQDADKIKAVLQALIDSHPYETPAYEVWSIKTLDDF